MATTTPKRILIVRNDKLGDFTLSLPTFHFLKQALPDCELHALVPEYTRPIADLCNSIDKVIIDPSVQSSLLQNLTLASILRQEKYDAVITLFSTTRIGYITFLAGIPYRLAPATKLAQIFYNHRLTQRRSRSEKPESEYNLDMARKLLQDFGVEAPPPPAPPMISFHDDQISRLRSWFCQQHNIASDAKLVFIHSGSGGSANNMSLEQYAKLARMVAEHQHTIVLTCGPGEEESANSLSGMLKNADVPHILYHSDEGLNSFTMHLAFADVFIAGSTGPLHIAGALNVPTAGFYTRRRSATPLRWQTLNSPDRRLAFTPPDTADEMDMSTIDILQASIAIQQILSDRPAEKN